MRNAHVLTKSGLSNELRHLGVRSGSTVMFHVSVKALGWIVGGPDTIIDSLTQVIGTQGTLMMLVGWEESIYHFADWSLDKQRSYLEECPGFDPHRSRANRKWSIVTEYFRTRPGTLRSAHPESSFAASGKNAEKLTSDHPLQYGFGYGSPLETLIGLEGNILMLGAPLNSITLLHYAEFLASVCDKRIVKYRMPILTNDKTEWVRIEEFDSSRGIVDWPSDYFEIIGSEYLKTGKAKSRRIGNAECFLFDAKDLVHFGVRWMETHFTKGSIENK